MEWQGDTTNGWEKLLRAVTAVEKPYGVCIHWKEKFGTLRLWPQIGECTARNNYLAICEMMGVAPKQADIPELFPDPHLSKDDEADMQALCAAIELASTRTCQVCGARSNVRPHSLPDDKWVMTLCETCAQHRTQAVVRRRDGRGRPRYPHIGNILEGMCERNRQDLQGLLPALATETFHLAALDKISAEIPMPPFRDKTADNGERTQPSDTGECEYLLKTYANWLEAIANIVRDLPCAKVDTTPASEHERC